MSQAKRIPKHQDGAQIKKPSTPQEYTFNLNGETISLSETDLNDYYVDFVNSLGGRGKNTQEWNQDFTSLKQNILKGQEQGQYFDFEVGGTDKPQTISASTSVEGVESGFNKRGKIAKPGLGSNITGVKNDQARSSMLYGHMGQWLSKHKGKQEVLNKKADADSLLKENKDKEEVLKGNRKFYDEAKNSLLMGSNLYGPQIGMNDDAAGQYAFKRYWEDEDKTPGSQRASHINYINKLKSIFGDERLNDPKFAEDFKSQFNLEFGSFRDALNNANLDDPDLDLQGFYDTIGLGGSYSTLNDRTKWDSYLKNQTDSSKLRDAEGNYFSGLNPDDKLYYDRGLKMTEGLLDGVGYVKDGQLGSGMFEDTLYEKGIGFTGEREGLNYDLGKLSNKITGNLDTYDYSTWQDVPLMVDGKKKTLEEYLSTETNKDNPLYKQSQEIIKNLYSDFESRYNFSPLHQEKNRNRNPYLTPKSAENIKESTDISDNFTFTRANNSGVHKGSLLLEKTNERDRTTGNPKVQYRLTVMRDKVPTEFVGKIIKRPNGEYSFVTKTGEQMNLGYMESGPATNASGSPIEDRNRIYGYKNVKTPLKPQGSAVSTMTGILKKGGILKAQEGASLNKMEGRFAGVNTGEEYDLGQMANSNYKMTGADYAQLTALAADLGSLGAAFVPGANVGAAGIGAAGSVANYGAEVAKTGDWTGNLGNLGLNLALDTASLMPILGGAAKTVKIAKAVKKMAPVLQTLLGAAGAGQAVQALNNIVKGDNTLENYRALASGLTGTIYGKRALSDKALATTKAGSKVKIKMKDGSTKDLDLSESETFKLQGLDPKERVKALKDLAVKNNLTPDSNTIDMEFMEGKIGMNPKNWFSKGDVKINADNRLRTAEENTGVSGWFRERAAKRVALFNPDMAGASRFTGGFGIQANVQNPKDISIQPRMSAMPVDRTANPFSFNYRKNYKQGLSETGAINASKQAGNFDPLSSKLPERSLLGPSSMLGERSILGPKTGFSVAKDRTDISSFTDGTRIGRTGNSKTNRGTTSYINEKGDVTKLGNNSVSQLRKNIFGAKDTSKMQEVAVSDLVDSSLYPNQKGTEIYNNIENLTNPIIKRQVQKIWKDLIDKFQSTGGSGTFRLAKGGVIKKHNWGGIISSLTNSGLLGNLPEFTVKGDKVNSNPISGILKNTMPTGEAPNLTADIKPQIPTSSQYKESQLGPNNTGASGTGLKDGLGGMYFNPLDASELGRALFNRSVSKNLVNPHRGVALASAPQEIYSPVKGDLLTRGAYEESANRVRNTAGQPFSSDAGVQAAMNLSANVQAGQIDTQGAMADVGARRQQEAENLQANRGYADIRNQVANNNRQSMAARDQASQMFENQRTTAMNQSLDNFWSNKNMRSFLEQDRNRGITDQLAMLDAQGSKFGDDASIESWRGKTTKELQTGYLNQMNDLHKRINDNPDDLEAKNQLETLRQESSLLGTESNKMMLTSMLNRPNPSYMNIFGKKPIFKGSAGGRLTKEERKELIGYGINERNKASWVRDYNKWMNSKMSNDAKKAIASGKSIEQIVKIALNNK